MRSFNDELTSDVLMNPTVGAGQSGRQSRRSRTVVAMSPRRPSRRFLLPLLVTLLLAAGCGDQTPSPAPNSPVTIAPGEAGTVPLGERPFQLYVPGSYTS